MLIEAMKTSVKAGNGPGIPAQGTADLFREAIKQMKPATAGFEKFGKQGRFLTDVGAMMLWARLPLYLH